MLKLVQRGAYCCWVHSVHHGTVFTLKSRKMLSLLLLPFERDDGVWPVASANLNLILVMAPLILALSSDLFGSFQQLLGPGKDQLVTFRRQNNSSPIRVWLTF